MKLDKNKKLLDSFIKYCKSHKDQRFWQCLRNWAEADNVYIEVNNVKLDTFYFDTKRPKYYEGEK